MSDELSVKGHILITGGTGFVGRELSKGLAKAGYKVTTISRGESNNCNHICADLTNEETSLDLATKFSSIHTIIHCAALAHGQNPPKNHSVASFNTLICKNILKAFERHRPHWIFMSSISVYGDMHSESVLSINSSPYPVDSYGRGKVRDEKLFIANCDHLDILRLMPVYDSHNLRDIKKRVFLPKTKIKIKINPAPLYSICHIREVIIAVERCINCGSGQRIIQVGDHQPVSQNDLANWFSGRCILVPQLLLKAFIFILPNRLSFLRRISFMLKKVGLDNVYEIGYRYLD